MSVICEAVDIIAVTTKMVTIIVTIFLRYGLILNQKADKSEVMLAVGGRGAKEVKYRTVYSMASCIQADICGNIHTFRIVASYEHMGSCIETTQGMYLEACRRSASMLDHFVLFRKKLYHKKALSVKTRGLLASSLCMSHLLYNVGIWGAPSAKARRKLRHAYMLVWRSLCGKLHHGESDKFIDEQVLVDVEAPPLESTMASLRIKFAARFFHRALAEAIHVALLAGRSPSSWLAALMLDVREAHTSHEFMQLLPPPGDTLDSQVVWINDMALRPSAWRSIANRLRKSSARSITVQKWKGPTPVSEEETHTCYECGAAFDTFNKLASHASNKHGFRSALSARLLGTMCPACGWDFHERRRLLKHVKRQRAENPCAAAIMFMPPLSFDEIQEAESLAQLQRKSRGKKQLAKPPVPHLPVL